jgi:hypothetical protein
MPTIFESTEDSTTLPQATDSGGESDKEESNRIQCTHEPAQEAASNSSIASDVLFQEQHWHTKLCHLNKTRVKELANNGITSKYLARIDLSLYPACIYGKTTKPPWRRKSQPTKSPHAVTKPGECIAVDRLESTACLVSLDS